MTSRPTPEATRKDDVSGRPVTLADGNTWALARPTVRFALAIVLDEDVFGRTSERVALTTGFGFPVEIMDRIDALRFASERPGAVDQHDAFFALASALLRRAHDVDEATARRLLSVSDADIPELVRAVMTVVTEPSPGPMDDTRGESTP